MSGLFEANLLTFERLDPDMAARIRDHAPNPAIELTSTNGKHDLIVGGQSVYRGDAERYGVRHLRKFLKKPDRLDIPFPDELISHYLQVPEFNTDIESLREEFKDVQRPIPSGGLATEPYRFICMGTGLGFHLDAILDRLKIKSIFICEPNFDIFFHSLKVFDWGAFLAKAAERSVILSLYLSDDGEYVARCFFKHVGLSCPAVLDGTYVYRHYEHDFFTQVHSRIAKLIHLFVVEWGALEDEIPMLENTTANLKQQSVIRLIEPPPAEGSPEARGKTASLNNDLTAVIVGSGPSLKQSLNVLAELKGKAVIFSAGTALLPILKSGMRPDFHVEIERTNSIYLNFARIHRDYGLDDLPLILPTTIDPGFTKEFSKNVIYMFVRDHICTADLLSGLVLPLSPSGPSCDHVCLGAALGLGMRRIVFLGNDYGSRNPDVHHADGSIYEEDFYVPHSEEEAYRLYNEFPLMVPGNFGGEVHTNQMFLKRKFAIESAIAHNKDVEFYNMSDGARIEGAEPKTRITDIPGLNEDQGAEIRHLVEHARTIDIGLPVIEERLKATRRSVEADRLSGRLKRYLESGPEDGWIYDVFVDFLNDETVNTVYRTMVRGNIHRNLFIQSILANRVSNPQARRKFDRAFIEKFASSFRNLEDQLIDAIDSLLAA